MKQKLEFITNIQKIEEKYKRHIKIQKVILNELRDRKDKIQKKLYTKQLMDIMYFTFQEEYMSHKSRSLSKNQSRLSIKEYSETLQTSDYDPNYQKYNINIEKYKNYKPELQEDQQIKRITESVGQAIQRNTNQKELYQIIHQIYTSKQGKKNLEQLKQKIIYDLLYIAKREKQKTKYK